METLLYILGLLRPIFETLVYPAVIGGVLAYASKAKSDKKATANGRVAGMAFRTAASILVDLQQRGLVPGSMEWKVAFAQAVTEKVPTIVDELVTPLATLGKDVGPVQVKTMIENQANVIRAAGMSALDVAMGKVK